MEKRLRSSLHTSAVEFLSSASKLGFTNASKLHLKTLIHGLKASSEVAGSLPSALRDSISQAIEKFKNVNDLNPDASGENPPNTPPAKRVRRSGRNLKHDADESSTKKESNGKIEDRRKSVVESLQLFAYILLQSISHPKGIFGASDLLPAARELHDNLVLFESDSGLLSEIASVCEEWWKSDLIGKESLITRSLPLLLSRALTSKKKVHVHRLYGMREAFNLFDFDDESIVDLKHLMMRCVISPLFLKMEDGRKFIAFMFGLSGQLVKEALEMIRSQVPFGRKSALEAFGEITFRAWKAAEGEARVEIEDRFLQMMIDSAIHASSAAFSASIRRILGGFISQRTTDGVEGVLFRLAEPIIFRSLQVANSNVRQNALHLLLDLFPLEDPDATMEGKDSLLEKQFFLMDILVMDECPDVRVVAVEGCCRILHMFWEVIPSLTITKTLTKIFDQMVHDACTDVRNSAVGGIIYLLGNPHSHEVLKVLLPRLGHLILDSALSVRSAIVDLLLCLSDIRNFYFHKVVCTDALLSALASDQSLVAQKITKLLLPSYFPPNVTPEEACKRCVTLIKRSPSAGSRFCEFAVSAGATLPSLMELLKGLIRLVVSPKNLEKDQINGIVVGISHLYNHLVKEASFKNILKKELSGRTLKIMFAAATTTHAKSSICSIISTIPPEAVDGLYEECLALIINCIGLSGNVERKAEVRYAHRMMLSCGWFDEMLGSLSTILQEIAHYINDSPGPEASSTRQRKTKSSTRTTLKCKHPNLKKALNKDKFSFTEAYEIAEGIAWQVNDLLLDEGTRKALLGSRILETALLGLKAISEFSILQPERCGHMNVYPLIAYTALILHLSAQNIGINANKHSLKMNGIESSSNTERTSLDLTMDHLLDCTNKLFKEKRQVMFFLGKYSTDELQLTEEGLKETLLCLKSSFTYAAKLLNLVLKDFFDASTPQPVAYHLANELLSLTVSIEKHVGHSHATRLLSAARPWVPDLILAFGSFHLMNQTAEDSASVFPSWLSILAKIELFDLQESSSEEQTETFCKKLGFFAFKSLVGLMVQRLSANNDVLDAFGTTILNILLVHLESRGFGVLLGLLHFVRVKLVKNDEQQWNDLKMMSVTIQQIYCQLELLAENSSYGESEFQELQSAKALIEPVLYHSQDSQRSPFEE
ncbi:unnamed protein product [Cuscuta campestris]|uniref:Uncharacterized protein n=1 Tax=Cuscuta campestris TaxID=132261 RepID=A0A484LG45_9ASTE|nr:unnamed protein product [Cuscuta campestris]